MQYAFLINTVHDTQCNKCLLTLAYIDIPVSPVLYFLVNAIHDKKCYLCLLALADIDISREPYV
jgi:hypothetical protein